MPGSGSSLLLPLAVACPFVAAALVIALRRASGPLALAGALGGLAALGGALANAATTFEAPWLPALGVAFALRADGFGFLLAFLVAGIGALVVLYSLAYLADEDAATARRYYATLAVFMGSMLGIALADDLIVLFVFWELTSIASFLLIGHRAESEEAKAGALTALQVTALGGLAMSVGFLLIGQVAGTFRLSRIADDPALVEGLLASPLGGAALVLVLLGAFTKSAQVPFHFWLPRAMAAPTPISAYLHAATMVKAGVFLLGRMHPVFGTAPLWAPTLVTVGTVSMVLGAYQALRETDLKAILARTTASTLGGITLVYGIGATGADSLAILNHALYKGALFLVAGIVDHHAHTRSLDELGGLRRALPLACVACVLASLSMAGVPPLLGFVAKDELYATLFHNAYLAERPFALTLVVAASFVTSALLVVIAGRLTLGVFFGPERARTHDGHGHAHGRLPLWPAPMLLAVLALVLGVASAGPVTRALVVATASGYTGDAHVTLTPPLGPALLASLAVLVVGTGLYLARERVAALQRRLAFLPAAPAVWDRLMAGFPRLGEAFSRRWQNGSLRWYLAATVLAVPALCLPALSAGGLSWGNVTAPFADMPWYGLAFCAGLALTTVAAVTARTRLAAAIAMTATGFFVSMLFVVYRSPDILLTQLLIETASTIFILLVLAFLPPFRPRDLLPLTRLVHAGIAGAFGLTVTLLLLLATSPGLREVDNVATRPGGLLSRALADGGGANAVNVIIVDLRAIDTTGEVTVLVAVGLAVYGLLRLRRGPREGTAA